MNNCIVKASVVPLREHLHGLNFKEQTLHIPWTIKSNTWITWHSTNPWTYYIIRTELQYLWSLQVSYTPLANQHACYNNPHCKQSSNSAEEVLQIQIVQRERRKMRPLHCFGFLLQEFKHIQSSGCYTEFQITLEGLSIRREIWHLIQSQQKSS